MIQVRKKEKENSETLIRRFFRRIQQSGILKEARKTRFQAPKKTKRQKREDALYKVKIRKEIEKLKKMDRFDEESLKNIKKKID